MGIRDRLRHAGAWLGAQATARTGFTGLQDDTTPGVIAGSALPNPTAALVTSVALGILSGRPAFSRPARGLDGNGPAPEISENETGIDRA